MDSKFSKIAPLYGYLVCLVTIIVTFIALSMLVSAIFNYSDPIHANYYGGGSVRDVSSFEAYKVEANRVDANPLISSPDKTVTTEKLSDEDLKTAYNAARENKIASVRFNARQSMTNSSILILLSVILFVWHWRWLGRLNHTE